MKKNSDQDKLIHLNKRDNVRTLRRDPTNHDGDETHASLPGELAEAMKRNAENEKRLREERLKANRLVLRSYRIKT